jgi:thioredoxin-related protein
VLAVFVSQKMAPPRPPSAETLVDAAVRVAQSENKGVLIHFGATWCKWCKRLDAAFESPELAGIFHDNFVLMHLTVQESDDKADTENPGAEALMADFGASQAGIPIYLFLDKHGRRLASSLALPDGSNIGYPAAPEEIAAFEGLLEKTAPHMTAGQRETVSSYLRSHAP